MKIKKYVMYHFDTFDRHGNTKHKSKALLIHRDKNGEYVKYNKMFCDVGYYGDVVFLRGAWYQKRF